MQSYLPPLAGEVDIGIRQNDGNYNSLISHANQLILRQVLLISIPAHRAIRILWQFCGMPFHVHYIQQQQTAFQCFADTHDQFHGFAGLDTADDSEQKCDYAISCAGLIYLRIISVQTTVTG